MIMSITFSCKHDIFLRGSRAGAGLASPAASVLGGRLGWAVPAGVGDLTPAQPGRVRVGYTEKIKKKFGSSRRVSRVKLVFAITSS
jgi:hypothetical protein